MSFSQFKSNMSKHIQQTVDYLSTSPRSVTSLSLASRPILTRIREPANKSSQQYVSLEQFVDLVPFAIRERKLFGIEAGSSMDPILNLFNRLDIKHYDWVQYAHFDESRNYTRNLVATDGATYTLLLLCWNPGKGSPIHDHPCDGCWMKVLSGNVQECRYEQSESSELRFIKENTFTEDDGVAFIHDSIGFHKVGNPSLATPAVSLHLYSPPFQQCRIWIDEHKPPSTAKSCHFSEYGMVIAQPPAQP